jgi:hypothetical protein
VVVVGDEVLDEKPICRLDRGDPVEAQLRAHER